MSQPLDNTLVICGLVVIAVIVLLLSMKNGESYGHNQHPTNKRLQQRRIGEDHSFHNDSIDNPIKFANNGNLLLYIPVDANLLQLAGTGVAY